MKADILSIDKRRFNNLSYLEKRVLTADAAHRGSLRTALKYLYFDDGPINLQAPRRKLAEFYLEPAERIVARWLSIRTNGRNRKIYGSNALRAARSSRYRCKTCGFSDVRALNLDHVNGRHDKSAFACLCANCHCMKSRAQDWSGKKREKNELCV